MPLVECFVYEGFGAADFELFPFFTSDGPVSQVPNNALDGNGTAGFEC